MTQELINLYSGKKIVITGCSGFIGGALISNLKSFDVKILGISRKVQTSSCKHIEYLCGDVSSYTIWEKIVDFADIIFHLAGNTSVYEAENDPEHSFISSVLPIMHLIKATKKKNKKVRVVFASTATLYGFPKVFPVTESTLPNPITVYDLHKLFAENALELANIQNILENVSLRLANVYGPSSSISGSMDRGIVNRLTKEAILGVNPKVYGHGNYFRDYVFIDDVVTCFLLGGVLDRVSGKSFVVASGNSITVYESFKLIAEEVTKVTGQELIVENTNWPEKANEIEKRNFLVDTQYFETSFGWKPKTNFKDGIKKLIINFIDKTN